MSFTWNELVGIGLIKILRDPELVLYFLKILKLLRCAHLVRARGRGRDFLDDEYRSFYLGWDEMKVISPLREWPIGNPWGWGKNPGCRDILTRHTESSLKTRQRITFFREDSILIHPIVEWRKGDLSYEEASTYFLNGGTYLGCRRASIKEKIYSIKNLLTEQLIDYVSVLGSPQHLLMIDGGPGEGMPEELPEIPYELVKLKMCFI